MSMVKGRVEIRKIVFPSNREELILSTNNLVVYTGREFVLPSLLKYDNPNITPKASWGLYFWSVGNGGLLNPLDPLTRIPPNPSDVGLNNELSGLDINDPNTTPDGRKRRFSNVTFVQDTINDNKYLITSLSMYIGSSELVGSSISEAGLWISNDSNAKFPGLQHVLFSKVTFNPVQKASSFSLVITWYLYT